MQFTIIAKYYPFVKGFWKYFSDFFVQNALFAIFEKNFLFFSKTPLQFCGKYAIIYGCMDESVAHPLRRFRENRTIVKRRENNAEH